MIDAEAVRRRPGRLWPAYLAAFTFMVGQWATGVAVPLEVGALGGTLAQAGAVAAIRFGMGAFFSLPFGSVADAWGTRRTLAVAVTGNALVHLLPIVAVVSGSIVPLFGWAVLSGLASSLFLPANSAYVAGTARFGAHGSAFGRLTLSTHLGWATGPVVGGFVWQHFGAAATFATASALGSVAIVAPLFVARSIRARVDLRGLPRMVAGVVRDRGVVGSWLAALGIGLPWGAVSGLFPLFGTSLGISAAVVGLLLGLQSVANGASRVPLGWLIDRYALPPLVAAGTCLLFAGATSLLGIQAGPLAIAIVLVTGIWALAFTLMVVQVTISERAPAGLRATGLGGYSTFLSAGLGIGPFVAGAAADAGGFGVGFTAAAALGALAALASGVLLWGVRRPPGA